MPEKFIDDFAVVSNQKLNNDTFLLVVRHPEKLPPIYAGQFAEVAVEGEPQTFLRRPLSIHDVDFENNTVSLFVKIVGKGTAKLSMLKAGEKLNMVYPLGNGFSLEKGKKVLLAGGGCGVAPLLYLAKCLKNENCDVHIILAGKKTEDILLTEVYNEYGNVYVTTEDGSVGEKGLIIQHSVFKTDLKQFARIYTCGPERMMQAIARIAKANGLPCEVSLENTMACGIGACLCCVVQTHQGNKCVCVEGPVFNINDLTWQI